VTSLLTSLLLVDPIASNTARWIITKFNAHGCVTRITGFLPTGIESMLNNASSIPARLLSNQLRDAILRVARDALQQVRSKHGMTSFSFAWIR
jgi:hypothetical protein